MAGGILALDLATTTGWAYFAPGAAAPIHGSETFEAPNPGCFGIKFEKWLDELYQQHRPRWMLFEAPFIGEKTHQDTARKLQGLAVLTEVYAEKRRKDGHELDVFEVNNIQVKIHFVGRSYVRGERKTSKQKKELSDAMKRLVIEECVSRGWMPDDDNEADALSIVVYGAAKLVLDVPFDVRSYKDRMSGLTLTGAKNYDRSVSARVA